MKRARLAADIGGTFTDVVLEHRGRRYSAKVLTTPRGWRCRVLPAGHLLLENSP